MKISGVYKITNTVTGDFYIGSSKDVKKRWKQHKKSSVWKYYPNNPMYQDMKKYGVENFDFQILEEVEIDKLKESEQQLIEKMHPTYNSYNANGLDINRYKKSHRKASNKYNNQLCCYNNEKMTLAALSTRFRRAGIKNPTIEAKKYLIKKEPENVIEFYDVYP